MGTDKGTKTIDFNNINGNKPILIRRCTLEDLEGVIEINEKELPEDYPYFFYKSILDNFNESFLIAVDSNNIVVGYIMWRVEKIPSIDSLKISNKGHLVSIAVVKGFRRLGIAKALLTQSMQEIKKRLIDEFVLEVRVSNYTAINLYKKFNFSTQNIKYKYYRDGENAYFMVCKVK